MTEILKSMIAAIGIDIGKNCFHEGLKPVLRERPDAQPFAIRR
jgi:hypothetical protein